MNGLPNWVDLLIVILVVRGGYVGVEYGFYTALIDTIGSVSATALSLNAAPMAWKMVEPWSMVHAPLGPCLVFWLLFAGGLLLWRMVLRRMTGVAKWERAHWLLQGLALSVGAARGVWWAGVLVLALASSGLDYLRESVLERSLAGPSLAPIATDAIRWTANRYPGAAGRGEALIPPPMAVQPRRKPATP